LKLMLSDRYMKLGLQGITMLFASGDNGVAGGNGQCCASPQCAGGVYNDGKSGAFNPSFPSTCPYVTSVGVSRPAHCPVFSNTKLNWSLKQATQIKSGATITTPEEAADFPELQFWSGGGFSNVFPTPSYQTAALKYFFSHNSPDYSSRQYNNTQHSRGYPDIAANGVGYVCTIKGQFYQCYGTSMSTPVVASLITLINEERIKRGKGPVGFLNPVLYANAEAMNDIKVGGNEGCGTSGFRSVTGWVSLISYHLLHFSREI
jgi:tripeptidyl-peptidase-1